jgi:phosphinothricin acetyltransferase
MRVRDAHARDAPALAAIYRPYVEQSAASFEDVAPDAGQLASRMRGTPRLPWLAAEDDAGRVVGYAYASRHRQRPAYRWAVECSVYLVPELRHRGTGRRLYSVLLPVLSELGYRRAYAGITLPNPASVGLHEATGFTLVGVYQRVGYKLGSWHDVGWWQLSLERADHPRQPPEEPKPWCPDEQV